MNDIAGNIRNLRKEKGMSQEQLAQKLHVTRQTVSAWERGIAQPSLDTLEEIARALKVEPERLLYGTGTGKQRPTYSAVSFWPVLGIVPLYIFTALILLPIPMTAWLGSHDVVFALCGQIFLAMLITGCYCGMKDTIKNQDFYAQIEREEDQE